MTESEGGKAALHLEKEMLNVFPGMDPCYRSEHRSVVLHLQGAERQVCGSGGRSHLIAAC